MGKCERDSCKLWTYLRLETDLDDCTRQLEVHKTTYKTRIEAANAVWAEIDETRKKLFAAAGRPEAYSSASTLDDFRVSYNVYALLAEGDNTDRRWKIIDIDLCDGFGGHI